MADITFQHRLDLVVRLVDATTGISVEENQATFRSGDRELKPLPRGSGNFIFINTGRDNFPMQVSVRGFRDAHVQVRYEEMDESLPVTEVFLIPSENIASGERIISFTGNLPGITAMEAVNLGRTVGYIGSFDAKRCIMGLMQGSKLGAENIHFGLIHRDKMDFEHFTIKNAEDPLKPVITKPLEEEFSLNSPIARIVFGQVDDRGNFNLSVRDDATNLNYLIGYEVNGERRFIQADFHKLSEVELH